MKTQKKIEETLCRDIPDQFENFIFFEEFHCLTVCFRVNSPCWTAETRQVPGETVKPCKLFVPGASRYINTMTCGSGSWSQNRRICICYRMLNVSNWVSGTSLAVVLSVCLINVFRNNSGTMKHWRNLRPYQLEKSCQNQHVHSLVFLWQYLQTFMSQIFLPPIVIFWLCTICWNESSLCLMLEGRFKISFQF